MQDSPLRLVLETWQERLRSMALPTSREEKTEAIVNAANSSSVGGRRSRWRDSQSRRPRDSRRVPENRERDWDAFRLERR